MGRAILARPRWTCGSGKAVGSRIWLRQRKLGETGLNLGIVRDTNELVDAAYAAAIKAGGTDEGILAAAAFHHAVAPSHRSGPPERLDRHGVAGPYAPSIPMICSSEKRCASCSGPCRGPERTSNWIKPAGARSRILDACVERGDRARPLSRRQDSDAPNRFLRSFVNSHRECENIPLDMARQYYGGRR